MPLDRSRCCSATRASSSVPTPLNATRASPMSRSRSLGSRSRQRVNSRRTVGGVAAGSACRSSVSRSTEAMTSEISSPLNARWPVSISNSTTPNAQMSARLSTLLPARLLGSHVRGRAENHPGLRHRGRRHRRRRRVTFAGARAGPEASIAFASPKSSTLTVPSRADLDVRGFEIAMNDALLVRGFERLGDLLRDGQRLIERESRLARSAATDRRPRPVPSRAR